MVCTFVGRSSVVRRSSLYSSVGGSVVLWCVVFVRGLIRERMILRAIGVHQPGCDNVLPFGVPRAMKDGMMVDGSGVDVDDGGVRWLVEVCGGSVAVLRSGIAQIVSDSFGVVMVAVCVNGPSVVRQSYVRCCCYGCWCVVCLVGKGSGE